jgi:non-ribosomal peptide synthetase component F
MFGEQPRPRFPTVTDAILHQVATNPQALAAVDLTTANPGNTAVNSTAASWRRQITYAELSARSKRVARELRALGVQPGTRIPLVVKRSIDMLVGLTAVLACGCQYVPLDGGVVPDSTLKFVVEQAVSGSGETRGVVLVMSSTKHRFQGWESVRAVSIDELDYPEEGAEEVVSLAKPEHGCYVIYTSGEFSQ